MRTTQQTTNDVEDQQDHQNVGQASKQMQHEDREQNAASDYEHVSSRHQDGHAAPLASFMAAILPCSFLNAFKFDIVPPSQVTVCL